jgi:TatD DNase family protein
MIDFHCHLDLYPRPLEIVNRCHAEGLYVLSVTTVPSAFEGTLALVPAGSRIRTAIGLHPELAASRRRELPLFEKLISQTRYVGEVGLDGSAPHRETLDVQKCVLRDVLSISARAGGRIISLHSRGAAGLILDTLSEHPDAGQFVLHWYMGSKRQVQRAAELGCWFSVNPAMLYSETGRIAIASMPHDRILPESDGPFGKVEGQPVKPWEAWRVTEELATRWGVQTEEAKRQVYATFKALASKANAA